MKVNKEGYSEKKCIGKDFPEIIRANKIKTEEGYERYCGICGELITIDDCLDDGSVLAFILRVVVENSKEKGKKSELPQVFAIHKRCYLSHFQIMKGIIEYYKDEFFVEGI